MSSHDGVDRSRHITTRGLDRFRVDELLEHLFHAHERAEAMQVEQLFARLDDPDPPAVLAQAEADELVWRDAGGVVRWTPRGEARATAILRRHRLAEVLLTQVLEVPEREVEPSACEMEHILSNAVTDSVCSFLGHPPRCPHGRPIPSGDCCRTFTNQVEPLIVPLVELGIGKQGKVVFMSTAHSERLKRLADLGLVPGARVRLTQRRPSHVIHVGETTIALERDIAREIYVRREE